MSTVINHPAHLAAARPVVFIPYLAAIAIIEAIHSYDLGYGVLPVKLKWPNDICKSTACHANYRRRRMTDGCAYES
jgi:biotin-(acetyl-CoA carboxylase) ligase